MTCPHAETQYFGDGVYRCVECGDVVDRPKIAFAPAADSRDTEVTVPLKAAENLRRAIRALTDCTHPVTGASLAAIYGVDVELLAASVPEDHDE